ncbi:hypothetical protein [Streptomyces indicus]|uniref:Uncharacterized protein n=1 Tax=Streptomyces indicus TaxID=417292 RepID=A0A1G9HC68_9ACTN|nr:hypothetical protein [Streptomyces indicus]SDL10445.1 hypothetical protein SAMN05421806_118109 [Streptomyces indicus]
MSLPTVTVTVNRIRHTLAEALGWGRPSGVAGPLALAGALHPPADGRDPGQRAPEVAAEPATAARRGRARRTSAHTVRG